MTPRSRTALFRPRSLASRFLMIALGGVLVPLALVGLWLTNSAERAGTALLRAQLSEAADALSNRFAARWVLRDGELQLLANNSVAVSLLQGRALTPGDSAYLRDLARGVSPALAEISYRDTEGRVRWTDASGGVDQERSGPSSSVPGLDRIGRVFAVDRAVLNNGIVVGTVTAYVRLSSVLPLDSTPLVVPSGVVTVFADSQRVWSSAPDTIDVTVRTMPEGWTREQRTLALPRITLAVAAPVESFVAPFKRATRMGLSVLAGVAAMALLLTIVLTRRVTQSLDRLVEATATVSAGNLDQPVAVNGIDEIERLADAFNAMTVSLRGTLAELSQQRALAAVGDFASTLSHEVRNSLTAVRADLQHATRYVPRTDTGGLLVGRALDSVRRLDATVTSALRVARGGTVPMVSVSMDEVLTRAINVSAPAFEERDVKLAHLVPQTSATLLGDAAALEQLFVNLLLNAAQALEPGGSVGLHVGVQLDTIVVHVTDNGPGMPPNESPVDRAPFRSTKPYGTGLGLPIARRLAEMHGGTLTISSAPGSGTDVQVTLPARTLAMP